METPELFPRVVLVELARRLQSAFFGSRPSAQNQLAILISATADTCGYRGVRLTLESTPTSTAVIGKTELSDQFLHRVDEVRRQFGAAQVELFIRQRHIDAVGVQQVPEDRYRILAVAVDPIAK